MIELSWLAAKQAEHGMVFAMLSFKDWRFHVKHPTYEGYQLGARPYLQIEADDVCSETGKPLTWRGRKWQLSYWMTETELVRTAYLAVRQAQEHELQENFRYCDKTPYNPHFDVVSLTQLYEMEPLDGRTPPQD